MTFSIIAAMDQRGVIGANMGIPWRLRGDMRHFVNLTKGHAVIMGRTTADSIFTTNGGPLKNRRMIVLSRDPEYRPEGCEVLSSWEGVFGAISPDVDEVFIAGGAQIYSQALPFAKQLYLTRVLTDVEGDTFFPPVDFDQWKLGNSQPFPADEENEYPYTIEYWERRETDAPICYIAHARGDAQRADMESLEEAKRCPFCWWNVWKKQEGKILRLGKWWIVTPNLYPYKGTRLHLLFIYRHHTTGVFDITDEAMAEYGQLIREFVAEYGIAGAAHFQRFGNPQFNGGSLWHPHAHLVVGNHDEPDHQPVRAKIG